MQINGVLNKFQKGRKMKILKKSGPAIFMYCVIALTLIISIICFSLYYRNVYKSGGILWTGIVAFTIMYHFWVRIIMGNVSKILKKHVNYKQAWFKERKFEKTLYKILHVKDWKRKALTYNPEQFSLKENSLEELANNMSRAEVDHWINELIALSTILFSIPWGAFWVFFISAIVAMMFDGQFIIIQRYNRPRVVRIINKVEEKNKNKLS